MDPRTLLDALRVAERLKDTTRHCTTSSGRRESVAEHCWMTTLMAFFLREEFPAVDMDKVLRMCVIHDLGECFTGDIPVFAKNAAHEEEEAARLRQWVDTLPQGTREEMRALYAEMAARETAEAKVYKCLDGLEALMQHNLSDISTWEEHEYDLNLTYAWDRVAFSPYLTALREELHKDTVRKIEEKTKKQGADAFERCDAALLLRIPQTERCVFFMQRRGILIHPEELDATWADRLTEARINVLGLHPAGGKQAHLSLESAIHRLLLPETRREIARLHRAGIEVEVEAHAMAWLLPRSLFSLHPDWFRMDKEGSRNPDFNLCPSSEDALEYVARRAEMLARMLDTGSDRYYFWLDDVEGCDCQCEKCAVLSPSDKQLIVVNAMLVGIRRYKPTAKLCYLAYQDTMAAPAVIQPLPGVFLEYAPFYRDAKRPLFDETCDKNVSEVRSLRKLLDVFGAQDAQVLEYWMDNSMYSGWKKPPQPFTLQEAVMQQDVKSYRELGFESITSFGCFLGQDYRELYGEPPVKRYGEILIGE